MSKQNVIDEILKVSVGFFKSLEGAKDYSKERLKNKLKSSIEKLDLVRREEFEELRAMCVKVSKDNKVLLNKIKLLEKKAKN